MRKTKLKYLIEYEGKGNKQSSESEPEGLYPFYSCSTKIKYSNNPSFIGTKLLISTGGQFYAFLTNGEFDVSTDVLIHTIKEDIEHNFLMHFLEAKSNDINDFMFKGMGIKHLDRGLFYNIEIHLPDLATQQRIASFLDAETSKIDSLAEELTKFKANLLLQKRSLVSECVTKGIPSERDRAYKDSGVEWLGEIPAGWEISKLKRVASCHDNLRKPLNAEERGEIQGDYPYWGANSIQDYVNDYLVEGETILLGEDAAPFFDKIKSVAFYTEEKIWPNNHIHVLKAKPEIMAKYLTEALNIVDYSAYISGSIRDKLTQGAMMRILVPMPPLDEQVKIIQYIDSEVSKINSLISEIDNQIGLLKTYRKSLINEVVTGKVEV